MKKAKTITILLLIIFLIISISILIIQNMINKRKITQVIENTYSLLDTYKEKEILYLKKIKDRNETIESLGKPRTEKEIIYNEIVKKDTKLIKELRQDNKTLKNQLEKTNETLKSIYYIKHGFNVFALAGLDRGLNVDVYTGVAYRRYFLQGRLFVGGGVGIKLYQDIGVGGILELGFTF